MISFLERRNAKIIAPFTAKIDYGTVVLQFTRNCRGGYDQYWIFGKKNGGSIVYLLIPKIRNNEPGYFDMFGEKIECEKDRKR